MKTCDFCCAKGAVDKDPDAHRPGCTAARQMRVADVIIAMIEGKA